MKTNTNTDQTPQSTFDEKLQEAMYQNVQITALGNFPEAVPGHKNWVNIMGNVFSLDFNQASAAIKALVLEDVIGRDEDDRYIDETADFNPEHGAPVFQDYDDAVEKESRNELRAQQRSIITKGE